LSPAEVDASFFSSTGFCPSDEFPPRIISLEFDMGVTAPGGGFGVLAGFEESPLQAALRNSSPDISMPIEWRIKILL